MLTDLKQSQTRSKVGALETKIDALQVERGEERARLAEQQPSEDGLETEISLVNYKALADQLEDASIMLDLTIDQADLANLAVADAQAALKYYRADQAKLACISANQGFSETIRISQSSEVDLPRRVFGAEPKRYPFTCAHKWLHSVA